MEAIASTSKEEEIQTLPAPNISEIKNKQLRQEMYRKFKQEKRKILHIPLYGHVAISNKELEWSPVQVALVQSDQGLHCLPVFKMKLQEKKKKMKEAKAAGEEVPKQKPKTIESMRVYDETMVNPQDEEVQMDEAQDEMSSYFNRETTPKILLTTSDRPRPRTNKLCKELVKVIPNVHLKYRRALELKKIIPQALARDFTDIIIINEDRKIPNGMTICHLPNGPTATFKMTSVKLTTEIKNAGALSSHMPEVILNNFNTRLGHSVGRMLASLFPHDPQFQGRRAITFHNQRDFIFFRHHRYVFRSAKKVGLQELGPRFTLKLRSLQKGTFDTKYGEYEFIHKRHEMDTSRRKFFL